MGKVKAGTEFTVYAKTLTDRTATIQVTGEDTIDEVKARIEENYFDLLQTDLKVKSKDDIKVIYSSYMLEIHLTQEPCLTVLWNPTR